MLKTLSIKNISKDYHKMVEKHDGDVTVKKYLSSFGLYDGHINNYSEEYEVCFSITYENNLGEEDEIVFAYKYNDKNRYSEYKYRPDVIIGGCIYDSAIHQAIYDFCEKYGEYLLDGYDIVDIAQNDKENILNYTYKKKFSEIPKK